MTRQGYVEPGFHYPELPRRFDNGPLFWECFWEEELDWDREEPCRYPIDQGLPQDIFEKPNDGFFCTKHWRELWEDQWWSPFREGRLTGAWGFQRL